MINLVCVLSSARVVLSTATTVSMNIAFGVARRVELCTTTKVSMNIAFGVARRVELCTATTVSMNIAFGVARRVVLCAVATVSVSIAFGVARAWNEARSRDSGICKMPKSKQSSYMYVCFALKLRFVSFAV